MLTNPFVIKGTDTPASQLPAVGTTLTGARSASAHPIANADGEINASSRRDAMQQISTLINYAQQGMIQRSASAERAAAVETLATRIAEAHLTHNAANFGAIGEEIEDQIRMTVERTGFVRHFLKERELKQGEETKLTARKQDVMAFTLETDAMVPTSRVQAREIYSREFYVSSQISIELKDLERLRGDFLSQKMEDGYEMVQVSEDRMFKKLADAAASAMNVPTYFSNLTLPTFQRGKNQVESRGLRVSSAWMANDLWNDVIGDQSFVAGFDPVTRHELILTGELGSMLGVTLYTDAFLEAPQRVLSAGQLYFFAAPANLGQLLVRVPLRSQPLDFGLIGKPAKGWNFVESIAPIIGNAGGVGKCQRL